MASLEGAKLSAICKGGSQCSIPQKLTDFFLPVGGQAADMWSAAMRSAAEEKNSSDSSNSSTSVCTTINRPSTGDTDLSPPDSPSTRSPDKFKKTKGDLQEEDSDMEESASENSTQTPLEQFPSSS